MHLDLLQTVAAGMVALPLGSVLLLSAAMWLSHRLPEAFTRRLTAITYSLTTLLSLSALVMMLSSGRTDVRVELGPWFHLADLHYDVALQLDRLSGPFTLFGTVLVGIVGVFSSRYLHREVGYHRFYLLLGVLGSGFMFVVLAGSLDLIFIGWGIVGISSALLIAFFHDRPAPVRHALFAFIGYRVCDAALLAAVVWLHHSTGSTAFVDTHTAWWGLTELGPTDGLIVGTLLVLATLAKSAQVPVSDWLPRAMEGPTPSSAVFYGALSIHLGPYLLLRIGDLISAQPILQVTLVVLGIASASHATFVGRVQTDIKSALAYASMTQVSIIFIEIGLGLRMLALLHIVGHASFRTLQILRSPSVLHEHHHVEQGIGGHLPRTGAHLERLVPRRLQPWLYRAALERGYFLAIWRDWVFAPMAQLVRWHDDLVDVPESPPPAAPHPIAPVGGPQ